MNKKNSFWLFGISLILLGASLFLNISHTIITNESIVLVFVGILATFVVVGNYAQVTEIRNSTNKQIDDLDTETQKKIDHLNNLHIKMEETSLKIEELEKSSRFNAAEAYRLFGIFSYDKDMFRTSNEYLLYSLSLYFQCEQQLNAIDAMLDLVLKNFKPENWNHESQKGRVFSYQKFIEKVKMFPNEYPQKQKILDLLESYLNEPPKSK